MNNNKNQILVCQNCIHLRFKQDFKNNVCVFDLKSIKSVGLYDSCNNHVKSYHIPNIICYGANITV